MTDNFKILTDASHIRRRFSMYGGSQVLQEETVFIDAEFQQVKLVAGLLKIINEIIDNSIDEHVRTGKEFADKIEVSVDSFGAITVSDNGRGIPATKVETPDGAEYQMVAAFTRARAGSNFDDENRESIGMNGVGSMITFVTSSKFEAKSADGAKEVKLVGNEGQVDKITTKATSRKGTTVKFTPDYAFFGLDTIDETHVKLVEERVKSLALAFPTVKFKFNGTAVKVKFTDFFGECDTFQTDYAQFGITKSEGAFQTYSLVNGLGVKSGTHIDHFASTVISELRDVLKRRKKVDITPQRLKQHLRIHAVINGFGQLKFDSQTKERVTNSTAECREAIGEIDAKKIVTKLMKNDDLIDEILAYTKMKDDLEAKKDLNKLEKKKKVKSDKYVAAIGKTERIFVVEGDCLAEDTLIIRGNGQPVALKDVNQGDIIISGDGKTETVVSKTQSLRKRVKIKTAVGDVECSHKHRMYVYDTSDKQFKFVTGKDIAADKSRYKLVRSKARSTTEYYEVISNNNQQLHLNGGIINYTDNDYFVVFRKTGMLRVHANKITAGDFVVSVV